eukprot:NODE_1153_length_1053_cov_4.360558_g793_i0.p1 GENE.NODE_1153_length_1053_cov_4.360558_g793_i0~~NODE_1153_length_1053_cov_4.360558_g793_i0.p1  ORF type:complete len:187 (+),score=75.31 NODE_1153_length_1053_cov_4.360558_g793_i0:74-634(+)
MADLYSIVVSLEHLEKAFVRDSVGADEYDTACKGLISKYKTLAPLITEYVPSLDRFLADYKMQCPAAVNRLRKGVSAVKEFGGGSGGGGGVRASLVFQIGQHFITLMDYLKLGQVAVDQLHPCLNDLVDTINKHDADFAGKQKLLDWLVKMNNMKASEELDVEAARQLLFDVERTYNDFHRALETS